MRVSRSFRTTAVAAVLALAAAACGGGEGDGESEDSGEESSAAETSDTESADEGDDGEATAVPTLTEGELSICSDIPYRPFEVEDGEAPSGYSGFDIDLVQAMADQLGLELVVQVTSFDAIQSGTALAADSCDMAASAMTINEEREQNVDFLEPYFNAEQSLLTNTDGPQTLDDVTSLGVQADTTGQAYAEENFDGDITEFDGADALFSALAAGNIDAILQDFPVNFVRAQDEDSLDVVETYPTGEQYGFAVREGNTELSDPLNETLQALIDDGTYEEIYDEYFDDDSGSVVAGGTEGGSESEEDGAEAEDGEEDSEG